MSGKHLKLSQMKNIFQKLLSQWGLLFQYYREQLSFVTFRRVH